MLSTILPVYPDDDCDDFEGDDGDDGLGLLEADEM